MLDNKKEYNLYDEKQLERKAITIEKFTDEIIDSKKCIGFQIWLNNFTAEIVNSLEIKKTEDIKNPEIKQFALAMQIYILNSKRLYNALQLTYVDAAESNYNLLRVIFESVLFSFYLYNNSEEVDEINKFFNERFLDIDAPFKKRKDCTPNELTIIERRYKYSPKNIRDSLYVDEQKTAIEKIYGALSTQSHTAIETINGSHFSYSERRVKDMFWYVKLLSFYNIITFLDNLPIIKDIAHNITNKKVLDFLTELKWMVSENGKMGDFFPNHPNIKKSRLYDI